MKESLTPEKIIYKVSNGTLNKTLATEQLLSLLEGSDDPNTRNKCIESLAKLNFKNEKVYNALESSLLSDENPIVRTTSVEVIMLNFLEEGLDLLLWVIQHEKSPLVMKTLIEHGSYFNLNSLNSKLLEWMENFALRIGVNPKQSKFFLDVESLFAKDNKNYELEENTYKFYKNLRKIEYPEPWLFIKDKHVEKLNYNYYNWKFLKKNQDIHNSLFSIKDLSAFLKLYRRYDIKESMIKFIPKSIGLLDSLRSLNLSENNIHKFPGFIFTLKSLEMLDLSSNNIQEVPLSIKNLTNLKLLNLTHNKIQNISGDIMVFLNSLQAFKL